MSINALERKLVDLKNMGNKVHNIVKHLYDVKFFKRNESIIIKNADQFFFFSCLCKIWGVHAPPKVLLLLK